MKSSVVLGLVAAVLPSITAAWSPLDLFQRSAEVQVQKRTLDPATSNTEGKCPSTYNCSGKISGLAEMHCSTELSDC